MTQSIYDGLAIRYDSSTLQTPYFAHLSARYREILDETLPSLHLSNILDIGCGTGLFMKEILRGTPHYMGIDISREMLRVAKLKSAKIGKAAETSLLRADAAALPLKTNAVWGVASIGMVLPHLSSYAKGLAEISRVLCGGGRFWLELDNKWSVDLVHYLVDTLTRGKIFAYGFSSRRQIERYVRDGEYDWDARLDNLPAQDKIRLRKISVAELKRLLMSLDLGLAAIFGVHIVTFFLPKAFPQDRDSLRATYIRMVTWLDRRLADSYPFAFIGGSLIVLGERMYKAL